MQAAMLADLRQAEADQLAEAADGQQLAALQPRGHEDVPFGAPFSYEESEFDRHIRRATGSSHGRPARSPAHASRQPAVPEAQPDPPGSAGG
jgi:hypothetical protein